MSYETSLRRNLGMPPDNHCQCKYYMMTLEGRRQIVAFVYAPSAEEAIKGTRDYLTDQGRPPSEADRLTARELGAAGQA